MLLLEAEWLWEDRLLVDVNPLVVLVVVLEEVPEAGLEHLAEEHHKKADAAGLV